MARWCLCEHCVEAIRSRGEKIFQRPFTRDDCTEKELETEIIECDWCEEEFPLEEMYVCE